MNLKGRCITCKHLGSFCNNFVSPAFMTWYGINQTGVWVELSCVLRVTHTGFSSNRHGQKGHLGHCGTGTSRGAGKTKQTKEFRKSYFKNWLDVWVQRLVVNGLKSSWQLVTSGAPQGWSFPNWFHDLFIILPKTKYELLSLLFPEQDTWKQTSGTICWSHCLHAMGWREWPKNGRRNQWYHSSLKRLLKWFSMTTASTATCHLHGQSNPPQTYREG